MTTWTPGPLDRITADPTTGIDEIVLTGVDIHLEAMSGKGFTLMISGPGGLWIQADLWTTRGPLKAGLFDTDNVPDALPIDPEAWK